MSRRLLALLGLVLLAVLAGCSAAGDLSLTPVNDTELANEASRSLPPDRADGAHGPNPRAIILTTIQDGSATANGTYPPVETEGLPYAVDGAYYEFSAEVVATHTETSVNLRVDYNGTADGAAVAYDDLSDADRRLVSGLFPPDDTHVVEGYDKGSVGRYSDAEVESSVLLSGDYAAIRYEGVRYPIDIERGETEVETYRYTATEVAPNAIAYGESLREEYAFSLSGLSDAERSVVDEATNGSYYAEPDDEAFESVLNRFLDHEAVHEEESYGNWVVRYRGQVYWVDLGYGGFDR